MYRHLHTQIATVPPRNVQKFTIKLGLNEQPSRMRVLQHGIDAAVEEFVMSGMNIYIGGGKLDDVEMLLDAISVKTETGGLIDVAFVSASPATQALLEKRELPCDLRVNFKRTIDLFIAPVTSMDKNCNAALDSDDIAGDKYGALSAEKRVLIILEEDLEKCESGIPSAPIKIVGFQPDFTAASLCSGSLPEFGIRGASIRDRNSIVTDLSLAPNTFLPAIEYRLQGLPQVAVTGFLIASKNTTAVVATRDLEPFDITSTLHSMLSLSEECRTTALKGEKREQLIQMYARDWKLKDCELDEVLSREFRFTSYEMASAFVRYVQYVGSESKHFPEINQANKKVTISVTTKGAKGVTELDTIVSKELSSAYTRMMSSSPEMAFQLST